jgi:hypothetical protein
MMTTLKSHQKYNYRSTITEVQLQKYNYRSTITEVQLQKYNYRSTITFVHSFSTCLSGRKTFSSFKFTNEKAKTFENQGLTFENQGLKNPIDII